MSKARHKPDITRRVGGDRLRADLNKTWTFLNVFMGCSAASRLSHKGDIGRHVAELVTSRLQHDVNICERGERLDAAPRLMEQRAAYKEAPTLQPGLFTVEIIDPYLARL